MPEIMGIRFERPELLTLEYVKSEGTQWNDIDFEYRSYWEGNINHYERLFWFDEPFTGITYELYPDGTLWGYSIYEDGYYDNGNAEFYPDGQNKSFGIYFKDKKRGLFFEWYENGQLKRLVQTIGQTYHSKEVRFDELGNIIGCIER
jgi:hypothetical protein